VHSIEFSNVKKKATVMAWTDCNEILVIGHKSRMLSLWDPKNDQLVTQNLMLTLTPS